MKISVITIAYNSARTIEDTIKSVIAQDYKNVEYIIIDGGSTDATLSIIERYRDNIAFVVSESDKGIYDAMNKGVSLATGDVIGILNSDDFYADDQVLTDIANKFSGDKCDAVYADLVYVDREHIDRVVRTWKAGVYKEGKFRSGWMPPHPTFFVRNEVYKSHGGYNLDLRSAADYELMLRFIHRYGIKISYLPRVITKMRVGGQSNVTLRNRIRANMEDRLAWKINHLRPAFYTLTWKPLSKVFQFFRS